jgi:hypothetical protein
MNANSTQAGMGQTGTQQPGAGGGDMVDKGVDYLEREAGHEQVCVLAISCTILLTDRIAAEPQHD